MACPAGFAFLDVPGVFLCYVLLQCAVEQSKICTTHSASSISAAAGEAKDFYTNSAYFSDIFYFKIGALFLDLHPIGKISVASWVRHFSRQSNDCENSVS